MTQELETIMNMYRKQIENYGDGGIAHILHNSSIIQRQIDAFAIYKDYLKNGNIFLDWGCRTALDAWLIRKECPRNIEIHGCDVPPETYKVFYESANLIYSQLHHAYKLPYSDNQFDVIVGSGVLEHVPNDYESLKELYRILRPEGYLIITFLPNSKSYTEFANEKLRNPCIHNRKYSIREAKKMLLHNGFLPIKCGYHQLMPSFSSIQNLQVNSAVSSASQTLYSLNKYLELLPILRQFSANIFVISKKKISL